MVCIINKYIITKKGFVYAKVKYNCYNRVGIDGNLQNGSNNN